MATHGVCTETSIAKWIFVLDWFQKKLIINIFKNWKKTPFWDHFWPILPKLNQWVFFLTEFHQVLAPAKSYIHAKKQKKSKEPFPRKNVNRGTKGRTSRQSWFYRNFIPRTGAMNKRIFFKSSNLHPRGFIFL